MVKSDEISQERLVSISYEESGQRIDNFLFTYLKKIPKSMIYRIIRQGKVRVNKNVIKHNYKLIINDKISIPALKIFENKSNYISPKLIKISSLSKAILYEDDYILVLNKPSYIAVHGGSGLNFGIIEALRTTYSNNTGFLELVHRLDRYTSGILLIAKKKSALRLLHKQIREKIMRKDYLALVKGQWQSKLKIIQVPLIKNTIKNRERIVVANKLGKQSETHFKIEERYTCATLLRCIPITGRTHQIRVHTQYAGHPIVFDSIYGDREFDKKLSNTGLSRLFLHASKLTFIHPKTNKIICIKAPLDEQLQKCLKVLRSGLYMN